MLAHGADDRRNGVRRLVFVIVCSGAALIGRVALADDFSGHWTISSKVGENPVTIECDLAQKGDALTGRCQPANFDPSEIVGTVDGSSAKWGYDVVFNGNENHVEYEAALAVGGSLSGTLHLGPMPTPFTAVRH
jgi:hypothetical protein